ncbi:MAG: glycosyltransferase [Streptosporangiaceae bacterium]
MIPEESCSLDPQNGTNCLRDWEGVIVLCAATSFTGIKAADHHMAEHLSRLAPVLYVDPPLSPLTPFRNRSAAESLRVPRLRLQSPGLAQLTPVVQPYPSRPALTSLTSVLARQYLRRAAARFRGRVHAVISVWPQYPVFGSCGEDVRVYWSQDDFVGGARLMGLNAKHLEARERDVVAGADFVAAVSPVLAQTWRDRGSEALLIPNGADLSSFTDVDRAPCPADVRLPGQIVGLIGHLNARIDLHLLEAIADRGRSLLLVGPKDPAFEPERFAALIGRPNVCWVGPKPFELLPGYLRLLDVGIVPYRDTAFNRGSFPIKTLEYLAAGRGVVATDLPSIRWLVTDLVAVASGPRAFADAVDRSLEEARSPAIIARRRDFASRHGWAERAAGLHAAIMERRGRRPDPVRAAHG